jgi:hypothetical protein
MRDRAGKALIRSWFVILCATTALAHAVYAAVRVMISYRALELGGDGATVGVRTTVYSLVPLIAALPIGRAVDGPRRPVHRDRAAAPRFPARIAGRLA